MKKIKNIAIIAHVDHGKTTLVDVILKQTGVFRENQVVNERFMDSNDLEREKGITILSKNASIQYRGFTINIIDTPGHADFGGEVQRIMGMVDSSLLVVDAFEGPMPQTRYVLKNSLDAGHKPILVINKIDRPHARPREVLNEVFDLFADLGASDEQLDFPVIYASAKDGFAVKSPEDPRDDVLPLLETIVDHLPSPPGVIDMPLQFMVSSIDYDNYVGRLATGRIHNGQITMGDEVALLKEGEEPVFFKITKLFSYIGAARVEIKKAYAGDIVSLAGIETLDVGATVADRGQMVPLPAIAIDEPTLTMTFMPNDSPLMGREGKYVTSRHLWDRLQKEARSNVSIKIERSDQADRYIVKGRGELQLSILIENMRREGYEFQVSRPEVIFREENGQRTEPMELAVVEVPPDFSGTVIEKLGARRGEMRKMDQTPDGNNRLEFVIPSRGLIGFRSEFLTETRGTGILHQVFLEYSAYRGEVPRRNRGVMIAMEPGTAVSYALDALQDRGDFFVTPGTEVYGGMVVGENSREEDMVVNVCKTKKLTNMRASGSEDAIRLKSPVIFSLEKALEYIAEDELLEITPENIRIRKKILDPHERKKASMRN